MNAGSTAADLQGNPSADSDAAATLLAAVDAMVRETHPGRVIAVTLDSRIERDLGLDSLARVELMLRLGEACRTRFPPEALGEAQTPRDLLRYLGHTDAESALDGTAVAGVGASDVPLPDAALTLVDVLEWHAARQPLRDHVLLYDERESLERIGYAALHERARRIAAGLIAEGVEPQQTVALMLPTGFDYLASFFGVLLAGAVPVPIYPPARLSQIEEHLTRHGRILANAGTVLIITVPEAEGVASMLRAVAPALRRTVTAAQLEREPMTILHRAGPDDLAFLQDTSGSTGDQKGVMLTHANLLANVRAMGRVVKAGSEDVFVSWLPLYHDMGLIGAWLGSLYHAMPLVLMSPLAFLSRPGVWLRAISRHRGTLSAAPNFAYELVARKLPDAELEGLDLWSWRLAFNGAEPVIPATLEAFAQRLGPVGFRSTVMTPVYGLAECSVGLAIPPLERGPRIDAIDRDSFARERRAVPVDPDAVSAMRVPACGRPLPGHEVRIVDDAEHELTERKVGRLQFRGPSATRGYYRNPDATRQLVRDGWLDSGDYAYLHDGEVYLTGRAKDLIIRGGRNIDPYELEQAVGALAGIRKGCVAVFASTDPAGGTEKLVVMAETRETDEDARAALVDAINRVSLDVIGMPADDIVLAPPYTVLKTSSGKIRRAASRDVYERGALGARRSSAWLQILRLALAAAGSRTSGWLRVAGSTLYGWYAWLIFGLLAGPTWAIVAAARKPAIGRVAVHLATRVFLRCAGMPVRRISPSRVPGKPHVLVCNHASYLDAIVLYAILPPAARYVFVAKRELASHWFPRLFLEGLGALFVERFSARQGAEDAQALVEAMQGGQSLVVFPEGTFSREAGLRYFRMGAFVAAARSGAPIATAALRGMRAVLRDRTWLPRRGRIEFELGATLIPLADDWQAAVRLRDQARSEMLGLCGEPDLGNWPAA